MNDLVVGNQLPILLISFSARLYDDYSGWESVTNPLDKLSNVRMMTLIGLGISYQSS